MLIKDLRSVVSIFQYFIDWWLIIYLSCVIFISGDEDTKPWVFYWIKLSFEQHKLCAPLFLSKISQHILQAKPPSFCEGVTSPVCPVRIPTVFLSCFLSSDNRFAVVCSCFFQTVNCLAVQAFFTSALNVCPWSVLELSPRSDFLGFPGTVPGQ